MNNFNWHCPYCQHDVTIIGNNISVDSHRLKTDNADGYRILISRFIVCPNVKCCKIYLEIDLREALKDRNGELHFSSNASPVEHWRLLPQSSAKVFPDYVLAQVRSDYQEACAIRDLSPKASATLARRALQGILRDFYKVKAGRLVDEIEQMKDKMDHELWEAIDGVRKVGNIGAHMEKDIDVIVDVDPDEANVLIGLLETLIEETYIARHKRQQRIKGVASLAAKKDDERKPGLADAKKPPST